MNEPRPAEETDGTATDLAESETGTPVEVETHAEAEVPQREAAVDEVLAAESNSARASSAEVIIEPTSEPHLEIDPEAARGVSLASYAGENVSVGKEQRGLEATNGADLFSRIEQLNTDLGNRMHHLEVATARLATDAAERAEHRVNREALYEKLDASTSNFHFQLMRPVLQRLSLLYDLVNDLGTSPPQDPQAVQEAFALVQNNLRDVMELNGVETISPKPGDAFDPRFHHVVTTEATTEESQDESIAKLVTDGFLYFGQNERTGALRPSVIRPARVVTWKFKASMAVEQNSDADAPLHIDDSGNAETTEQSAQLDSAESDEGDTVGDTT